MLRGVRLRCPAISRWVEFCYSNPTRLYFSFHAWYLDDGTIVGDTMVVGKVLELIMEDRPGYGLHLNVDKTEVFWPKEDPRSRLACIFPPNIARPLHGAILYYAHMPSPSLRVYSTFLLTWLFVLLWSVLSLLLNQDSVTDNGDLPPYPLHLGGLGVYSTSDVLNYTFLASRLQSADLQTKLIRHTGIVSPGPIFDDALSVFNTSMEIDLLSNPSEIAAPKLIKKMADIYFTRVTKNADSTFSLSSRQMALWTSQRGDHTSDWLRTIPISGLEQTMNGKTYRCVLCYRLGIPLFSGSKPCSACVETKESL
ncbi:hypothetical protein Tco_1472469 [Tanacetum coccineum]